MLIVLLGGHVWRFTVKECTLLVNRVLRYSESDCRLISLPLILLINPANLSSREFTIKNVERTPENFDIETMFREKYNDIHVVLNRSEREFSAALKRFDLFIRFFT